MNWDLYFKSLGIHGSTPQERIAYNARRDLLRNKDHTLSKQSICIRGCQHEALIISKDNNNEKKIVMMPDDPIAVGDYLKWNGFTWIVSEVNQDHTISYSGSLLLCSRILKWQDETGEIISKPCVVSEANGYNTDYSSQATTVDGIYTIKISCDEDTRKLTINKRFVTWNSGTVPEVCKLIKINPLLSTSLDGKSGILELALEKDLFNPNSDDALRMIADYRDPSKPVGFEIILTCEKSEVIIGGSPRMITSNVQDATWELIPPPGMETLFDMKTENTVCYVSAKEDYSLLGTSVLVRCRYNGEMSELLLKVVSRI